MTGNDVWQAAALLKQGKLVAIPTETVYGLAGNALDGDVVASIFETKGRPSFNPLIIHVARLEDISTYCHEIPDALLPLARRHMPGPLTLLLPKKDIVPDIVTAGSDRVAIRIPKHIMTLELLSLLDFPLAAPSANPFGYISPTCAAHVEKQLGDKIPYILDGGNCEVGLESTIVGMGEAGVTVYRKGGLPIEEIQDLCGLVQVLDHSSSRPDAPGMLSSHYAPRIPFAVGNLTALLQIHEGKKKAVIRFRANGPTDAAYEMILSPSGSLKEAAQRLFAVLRNCDELPVDIILSEWMPDEGLGRAINDRLKRAASTNDDI